MAFFKKDGEELIQAPGFVQSPTYSLKAEEKDAHSYPVDGWYWFDTLDQALAFYAAGGDADCITITSRQGKLVLIDQGLINAVKAAVKAALDAIQDPIEREKAYVEYDAPTWQSNSAFLQQMWASLGGTAEQLRNLFMLALAK